MAEPPSPVNELNLSLTSRGGETQNSLASSITKALSFNKKLFVLQNTLISSDQAERFLAQAVTMGDSIDIQQTMTEAAMDTLDMKIRYDPLLKVLRSFAEQVGGIPVEDKTVAPSNCPSCQPVLWQETR